MHDTPDKEIFEKPKDIDMFDFGMGVQHNMPCPVYAGSKTAVLNSSTGTFCPSWDAHTEGWRLVQVKPGREWLWNLVGKYLFQNWTIFRKISKPIKQQSNQGN
jgi:hypothetical protein